jgi:hypothetical protein
MKSMIGIVPAFALGFALPRLWNPVTGAAADPWRASGYDDDDWLHRSRSLDGLAQFGTLVIAAARAGCP